MPNDSMCRRYHAVAAANLQRTLVQCKYEIIFYEYLIYVSIVNITNILCYENLALYGKKCANPSKWLHNGMTFWNKHIHFGY